jgi:hypothetical protein
LKEIAEMRRLALALLAVALPLGVAAADDDDKSNENIGVDEAKDTNDAAKDAGTQHWWNPGGWGIGKATDDNDKEFKKDEDSGSDVTHE